MLLKRSNQWIGWEGCYPARFSFGLFLLMMPALTPSSAFAREFVIKQIADDRIVNRDAVIGNAGLVAWVTYATNEATLSITDIEIYHGDKHRSLTEESSALFGGSLKPQVQSNNIVWVASYRDVGETPSWILREVPDRDEGAPELRAMYRAYVDEGGRQVLEPISGYATNETFDPSTLTNEQRRHPSGLTEITFWKEGGDIRRITYDYRHDFAPSSYGNLIAWQVEKGWPFGWEIMVWDDGTFNQLTTNYYYDMAPKVWGRQVTWYGWDGHDFEIFLYDADKDTTLQITSNQYDDVAPVIWDGVVAWEGYPAAEADIFIWKDGESRKISDNIEDDINPRIWDKYVVWQGFDGDDFEIYLYDGEKTIKLTSNLYDDTNPDMRDGLITWMGYHANWDAEIYVYDLNGVPVWLADLPQADRKPDVQGQLTFNEEEDRDPKTAGGKVVWQVEREGRWQIMLAEPK